MTPEPDPAEAGKPAPESRHLASEIEHLGHESSELVRQVVPAWRRRTGPENRIPATVAILAAITLQLTLPQRYGVHPRWLLPGIELALLLLLTAINPIRLTRASAVGRYASLAAVLAISLDNAISAAILDYDILNAKASNDAAGLLTSGASIYLTNIIAFGIWYWELDRGGPFARAAGTVLHPDFLFPQMANPEVAPPDWEPRMLDYLYVSFTNVMAFSPTDTLPLSRWAKALMSLQSAIALSTVALVIARAVNVLK